jgi:hypothetical protein
MTNLILEILALFAAAGAIGFAAGWLFRAVVLSDMRRDLETDIDELQRRLAQARLSRGRN